MTEAEALALVAELRADVGSLKKLSFVPGEVKGAVDKTLRLLQYLIERGEDAEPTCGTR